MKSVMQKNFGKIARAEIQRSSFNRSHGHKTTINSGYLYPVFVDEILPGDTANLKMQHFARLATPIAPLMDNIYLDTQFFFVPTRLVWDNWQRFNGEQRDPGDSTDFLTPQMTVPSAGYDIGTLHDYMGLPVKVGNFSHHSLLHRAYNLIWNEWYRDQNLQDSVPVPRGDGPDDPDDFKLLRRGKRHDYFTSCLPWPQKGPAVELPLGQRAPLQLDPGEIHMTRVPGGTPGRGAVMMNDGTFTEGLGYNSGGGFWENGDPLQFTEHVYADLSDATAATINQLRQAFQIQRLYERDARGGTRYTEIIRSHFGVVSPDARLQRPEYLGGGSTPVNIHPVPQTSETGSETPQGNLAAYGVSSGRSGRFVKSFTEHGYIIGLVSVRADLNYQQSLDRMWSRRRRFDFYWPALSHIGEQAVLNKEIRVSGTPATDEAVFGYQERYAEMRFKQSQITGKLRSQDPQSLDFWHLAQDFGNTTPALNGDFIEENPPIDRVIAVPSEPHFILDSYFRYIHARPMPTYGTPGLVDHF